MVIPESGRYEDAKGGIHCDALLEKWLDAHRRIVKVCNQKNWFHGRRVQACQGRAPIMKTSDHIPGRVQDEGVQLSQARQVVDGINERSIFRGRVGA